MLQSDTLAHLSVLETRVSSLERRPVLRPVAPHLINTALYPGNHSNSSFPPLYAINQASKTVEERVEETGKAVLEASGSNPPHQAWVYWNSPTACFNPLYTHDRNTHGWKSSCSAKTHLTEGAQTCSPDVKKNHISAPYKSSPSQSTAKPFQQILDEGAREQDQLKTPPERCSDFFGDTESPLVCKPAVTCAGAFQLPTAAGICGSGSCSAVICSMQSTCAAAEALLQTVRNSV